MAWLTTLQTETPEQGFELATKMARMAAQPDEAIRAELRTIYERDADSLTRASQVVATNFQTVAAANNYWRTS